MSEEVKEVIMDTATAPIEGGGTRRRKGRGRRTRKQVGGSEEDATYGVSVEKSQSGGSSAAPAPAPSPAPPVLLAPAQPKAVVGGAAKPSVVVLAPAKKKPVRVMLVPKGKEGVPSGIKRMQHKKTFKAKRVRVTIDNTAKTVKRRRQVMQRVDAMSDEQVREAAVGAKLSRRDSVAKVPATLLRQMMKDYQSMRGMLL
jgi:hypothetical protein